MLHQTCGRAALGRCPANVRCLNVETRACIVTRNQEQCPELLWRASTCEELHFSTCHASSFALLSASSIVSRPIHLVLGPALRFAIAKHFCSLVTTIDVSLLCHTEFLFFNPVFPFLYCAFLPFRHLSFSVLCHTCHDFLLAFHAVLVLLDVLAWICFASVAYFACSLFSELSCLHSVSSVAPPM